MNREKWGDSFTIYVDILSCGTKTELSVKNENNFYTVRQSGMTVTKLVYMYDFFPHWTQVEGNLADEEIRVIGENIEEALA